MEQQAPKLFIATPMYGGNCVGYYAQSLLQTVMTLPQNGMAAAISFMFNESLIQRARNALANQFMKSDATHLMFIDADIRFNPADIVTMVQADKEIICGIYPKKEICWPEVRKAIAAGVPDEELKHYTGSFVVNLMDYNTQITVPINEPVEIWNGGTGFMLIKREVMEKLAKVVPSYNNDVKDLGNNMGADRISAFFDCSIEPGTERLLSEDYHFCKVARENGIKVWAAPWVDLSHVGTYAFEGHLIKS